MNDFYSAAFATVYDRHFIPDLGGIADRIRRYAETATGTSGKTMMDLCCGTGHLIAHFADNGYRAVGVDISEAMLELAQARNAARVEDGTVRLVQADVTDFVADERVDLVTCTGDSLNHFTSIDQLRSCFAAVRRALVPDGLFIFDAHSTTGLRMQNITYIRDLPDLLLTTKVTYDRFTDRAVARVVGFHRSEDSQTWERVEQNATNCAWPAEQVCQALADGGFSKSWAARLGDLSSPVDDPDLIPRLFFVAQA